jgi:hypothetical protein
MYYGLMQRLIPQGLPKYIYLSIVKVETGIVTLISYRHYLKIVGNNKL